MPDLEGRRVAIVHPWMPWYRVELFERLRRALGGRGVDLAVAHGARPPFAPDRGDEATLDWAELLDERRLRVLGRAPTLRRMWRPALGADLLILEDGLRNLDTWAYLLRRRSGANAFWGHGRTMDKPHSAIERRAKRALLARGDWWFAYTDGVRDRMIADGLPADRITALGNTFDTGPLAAARDAVDPSEVDALRHRLGLTRGHSALFIGGLGATKNLAMLVEAARIAATADPAFRLVVAGEGPERTMLEQAAATGAPVVLTGPVFDPSRKATLAAACDLMAMPGLVGLAAVDSLVLGLPAVAVEPWLHAPEFEYLEAGGNSLVTAPEAKPFAESMLRLVADRGLRERLSSRCIEDSRGYSLDGMVERFSEGIVRALVSAPGGR